MNMKRV